MSKKLSKVTVKSPHTGKVYRLKPSELLEFYEEQFLHKASEFRDKAIRKMISAGERIDQIPLIGTVLVRLFNQDAELAAFSMGKNTVVNNGRSAAIDRLQGATPAVHDYMAIGTSSTAAQATDTALLAETGTRVQGTMTQPTAYTDRLVSTFAAGNGTATIAEAGRLNAASTGNLFARYVFTGIVKGGSDSLEVTYDITD